MNNTQYTPVYSYSLMNNCYPCPTQKISVPSEAPTISTHLAPQITYGDHEHKKIIEQHSNMLNQLNHKNTKQHMFGYNNGTEIRCVQGTISSNCPLE